MKPEESQGMNSPNREEKIARALVSWLGYVTAALFFICASLLYAAWVVARSDGPASADPARDALLGACLMLAIGLVTACTVSYRSSKQ